MGLTNMGSINLTKPLRVSDYLALEDERDSLLRRVAVLEGAITHTLGKSRVSRRTRLRLRDAMEA